MKAPHAPQRPVTLQDIALAAGVHKSSVSLALRNQRGVPAATRDRIRRIAERLGYRPDPALDAFNALRFGRAGSNARHNLGFITDFPSREALDESPRHRALLQNVRQACAKRGHSLDVFPLGQGPAAATRLERILRARGIGGLFLAPLARPPKPDTPWLGARPCVSIGSILEGGSVDAFAEDHYEAARLLCSVLRSRGLTRPGFVVADDLAPSNLRLLRAGYLCENVKARPPHAPEFLVTASKVPSLPALERWVRRHRFDALVACGPDLRPDKASLEGIPLFSFDTHDEHPNIPGLRSVLPRLCEQALDLISMRISRGERASSPHPAVQLLPATWSD